MKPHLLLLVVGRLHGLLLLRLLVDGRVARIGLDGAVVIGHLVVMMLVSVMMVTRRSVVLVHPQRRIHVGRRVKVSGGGAGRRRRCSRRRRRSRRRRNVRIHDCTAVRRTTGTRIRRHVVRTHFGPSQFSLWTRKLLISSNCRSTRGRLWFTC